MSPPVPTEQLVARLASDREDWLPVLQAACAVAKNAERYDGIFAGRWVLEELGRQTRQGLDKEYREQVGEEDSDLAAPAVEWPIRVWLPGLRILVTYGLLEKVGPSTRGGRRAYYRMPDREGVEAALEALGRRGVLPTLEDVRFATWERTPGPMSAALRLLIRFGLWPAVIMLDAHAAEVVAIAFLIRRHLRDQLRRADTHSRILPRRVSGGRPWSHLWACGCGEPVTGGRGLGCRYVDHADKQRATRTGRGPRVSLLAAISPGEKEDAASWRS